MRIEDAWGPEATPPSQSVQGGRWRRVRAVLRAGFVWLALAPAGLALESSPASCPQSELDARLEAWTSGGRRYREAGVALSECLLADPDRFFRTMLAQRAVFDDWLESLSSHSFIALSPSQEPATQERHRRMTEIAAQSSKDSAYGSLPQSLSQKLAAVVVEEWPAALAVPEGAWEVSLPRPPRTQPPPSGVARDLPGVVVFGGDGSISGLPGPTKTRPSVSYKVRDPYPAGKFLPALKQRLEKDGWEPLPRIWSSWTKPSSLVTGWKLYPAFGQPKGQFHWTAQWRNSGGDILSYGLNYDTALPDKDVIVAAPDNDVIRVHAYVIPGTLVPLASLPEAFVVPEGARDVFAWQDPDLEPGKRGVKYTLRTPFPAAELTASVSDRLSRLGWEPLDGEPAPNALAGNPGWRSYKPDRGKQDEVFAWDEEWWNQAGERVSYSLKYQSRSSAEAASRASKPDNDELFVEASFRAKPPARPKDPDGPFYTSPSGHFRVRVPGSIGEVEKRERAPRPGDWAVSFNDELCRYFWLEERSAGLEGATLDEWIDRTLLPALEKSGHALKKRKPMTTELGPGVFLRMRQPGGAPCTRSVFQDGKERSERIDADIGVGVVPAAGHVYLFIYATSAGDMTSRLTGPVEEVMMRFVEDFELLEPAKAAEKEKPKIRK